MMKRWNINLCYRKPQAWIDHVIATDPALGGGRLTYHPRYSGRLRARTGDPRRAGAGPAMGRRCGNAPYPTPDD